MLLLLLIALRFVPALLQADLVTIGLFILNLYHINLYYIVVVKLVKVIMIIVTVSEIIKYKEVEQNQC